MGAGWWMLIGIAVALALIVAYDLLQRRHAVLRNFPVIGHLRFILEAFGPELRQYIVTNNDDDRPFNRKQRRWIYATSKGRNPSFAFGSDAAFERSPGDLIINPGAFPAEPLAGSDPDERPLPAAKVVGAARDRPHAFRPPSAVNISGMSFGALSGAAVRSLNGGAKLAGCLQNTGEGGISPHRWGSRDAVGQRLVRCTERSRGPGCRPPA